MEKLILVDDEDNELGTEEKYAAHRLPSRKHRAISVFIFNDLGQLLITRRSKEKKTWPGVWSNTCCSHPRPDEPVEFAAKRRLEEELRISAELKFLFKFSYKAEYNRDYGENELDHVFAGKYNGSVSPNPAEIDEHKFVDISSLQKDIELHPDSYTPWFKMILKRVVDSRK